jgi:hypothetical protein
METHSSFALKVLALMYNSPEQASKWEVVRQYKGPEYFYFWVLLLKMSNAEVTDLISSDTHKPNG